MAFTLSPLPNAGLGPFGEVPGPLGLPNPAGDLGAQIPNLNKLNTAASGDILSLLSGQLSAGTTRALQDEAATLGVTSGMPGSGLSWNSLYGNIANASQQEQLEGLKAYDALIPTVSSTQTVSPALETQIAGTNASNLASPNPAEAAQYAQNLFNQYLNAMRGPNAGGASAGSPSAGTGAGAGTGTGGNGFYFPGSPGTSTPDASSGSTLPDWGLGEMPGLMQGTNLIDPLLNLGSPGDLNFNSGFNIDPGSFDNFSPDNSGF